jgi:hypothetical protein
VSRRQPHKVSTLQVASKKKRQVKSIPRGDTREMQKSKAKQASTQIGNHLRNLGRFDLVSFFHQHRRHHRIWSHRSEFSFLRFFFGSERASLVNDKKLQDEKKIVMIRIGSKIQKVEEKKIAR